MVSTSKHNQPKLLQPLINLICIAIILTCLYLLVQKLYPELHIEPFTTARTDKFTDLASLDQILYINLDKREDRKKEILGELAKMGVPANKIQRVSGVYIPKNGHKGCVQSHILCLKLAQMNNWPAVAIFEDDAQIVPDDFKARLSGALAELPENWDVLMLATAFKKDKKLEDKKYINKLDFATTSSAYIIREHYYPKLIALFEFINMMMTNEKWGTDNGHEPYALDQKWTELQSRDNWFCLKNDIITQRTSASTINNRA